MSFYSMEKNTLGQKEHMYPTEKKNDEINMFV